MHPHFFKDVSEKERPNFIAWVNNNYVPGMKVDETWHPIIRLEIAKRDYEMWEKYHKENPVVEHFTCPVCGAYVENEGDYCETCAANQEKGE